MDLLIDVLQYDNQMLRIDSLGKGLYAPRIVLLFPCVTFGRSFDAFKMVGSGNRNGRSRKVIPLVILCGPFPMLAQNVPCVFTVLVLYFFFQLGRKEVRVELLLFRPNSVELFLQV